MKATFTHTLRLVLGLTAIAVLSGTRLAPAQTSAPVKVVTLSLSTQTLLADGQETHGDKGNNPPKGKG